MLAEYIS